MKRLIVRLQFKLASWLYTKGIIAPQLFDKPDGTPTKALYFLTPEESEQRDKAILKAVDKINKELVLRR